MKSVTRVIVSNRNIFVADTSLNLVAKFFCLAFLAHTLGSTRATAENLPKFQQAPVVVGTVVQVDDNSIMFLDSVMPIQENRASVSVRNWGIYVPPDILSTMVVGQRISCQIVYRSSSHIAGNCALFSSETGHYTDTIWQKASGKTGVLTGCNDEDWFFERNDRTSKLIFSCSSMQ
jgi:hypothetical protein